jgi:hypothetical protein
MGVGVGVGVSCIEEYAIYSESLILYKSHSKFFFHHPSKEDICHTTI